MVRVESFLGKGDIVDVNVDVYVAEQEQGNEPKNRLQTLKKRKRKRNFNGSQYIL